MQDREVGIGRDHVHRVGPHLHAVLDLGDLHRGRSLQQFRQQRLVSRIEMRHEHERHSRIRGHMGEELSEGLQPAGRPAHRDNGERGLFLARRAAALAAAPAAAFPGPLKRVFFAPYSWNPPPVGGWEQGKRLSQPAHTRPSKVYSQPTVASNAPGVGKLGG